MSAGGRLRAQPDIDQAELPGPVSTGPHDEPGLEGAERHGRVGPDRWTGYRSGLGVDTGRYVDRDGEHGLGRGGQIGGDPRSAPRPPMPTMPSTTRSAAATASASGLADPAAGAAQFGEPCDVRPSRIQQQRRHLSSTASQRRPGEQRVAAVVARADEQHHPGAVDPVEGSSQWIASMRRALHEDAFGNARNRAASAARTCTTGTPRHASSSRRLGDTVAEAILSAPSAITVAEAMPPSCDSDTCQRVTPRARPAPATVPAHLQQRAARVVGADLGVGPEQSAAGTERLGERLLGREPGGERLRAARRAPVR